MRCKYWREDVEIELGIAIREAWIDRGVGKKQASDARYLKNVGKLDSGFA